MNRLICQHNIIINVYSDIGVENNRRARANVRGTEAVGCTGMPFRRGQRQIIFRQVVQG